MNPFHARASRARRLLLVPVLAAVAAALAACGGQGGPSAPSGPNPPNPPPPADDAGVVHVMIEINEPAGAGSVVPTGFRAIDIERILVDVFGAAESRRLELVGPQRETFVELEVGSYQVTAAAFGEVEDVILFEGTGEVTIAKGDTVDVEIVLDPSLGNVRLIVGGKFAGTVNAVAATPVPFEVTVENRQGRRVPGVAVELQLVSGNAVVEYDGGIDWTDENGRVTGTVTAPHSGLVQFDLQVEGIQIEEPGPTGIQFATAVSRQNSGIVSVTPNDLVYADGNDRYRFTVQVLDKEGLPLPGVPVEATSSRNVIGPVDFLEPELGVTDENGLFAFTIRSWSSSFLYLENGKLRGANADDPDFGQFHPFEVAVVADGVDVGTREIVFGSPVDLGESVLTTNGGTAKANGEDYATLVVIAERLDRIGGGRAEGALVELIEKGVLVNDVYDIQPAPGFTGFRTNANGEWRGRIRSTEEGEKFFQLRLDGRFVNLELLAYVRFE